jgi:hypothetical protein
MARKDQNATTDAPAQGEVVNHDKDITVSSLTTNLVFDQKINSVNDALGTRSAAKKEIKTAWAKVCVILQEYEIEIPARRWDPVKALNEVRSIVVYQPQDKRLDDEEAVKRARDYAYDVRDLVKHRKYMEYLEAKFKGLTKEFDDLLELNELAQKSKVEDKEKTKEGRDKLRTAIREYINAIEKFDETVESVADVREFISVAKDVAEISAIANGNMANNSQV